MYGFKRLFTALFTSVLLASCGGGATSSLIPESNSVVNTTGESNEEVSQPDPVDDDPSVVDTSEGVVVVPVVDGSRPVDLSVPPISRISFAVQSTELGAENIRFTDLVEISEIPDESVIRLSEYPDSLINILAISSNERDTGSVEFVLEGPTELTRHENFAPYTLVNDSDHWDVANQEILPGDYRLSVTPYSDRDLTGGAGETYTISFTVMPIGDNTGNEPSEGEPSEGEPAAEIAAYNDRYTVAQGQTLSGRSVSSNDSVNLSEAIYNLVDLPNNGGVSMDIDGSFTYSPDAEFAGIDSFRYEFIQGDVVSTAIAEINVFTPVTSDSEGWTDFVSSFIAESDGSFSLGNPSVGENTTRDRGSKIIFVDTAAGNNTSADYYWYLNGNIVDSTGSATDAQGRAYGTDPLQPNLEAIKPFAHIGMADDDRVRTRDSDKFGQLAGMHPDWFLFRRGQTHTQFAHDFTGGQSEAHPMVVASYGPLSERRAIIDPSDRNPFNQHSFGRDQVWFHVAVTGLELRQNWNHLNFHDSESFSGGPPTLFAEDLYLNGASIVYPPEKSHYRRMAVAYNYSTGSGHVQGMFSSGSDLRLTIDETFFYKNGFKSDPRLNADPIYDKFSRNVYQSGGAQMGVEYINVISMDGGSGGPQMRLGGLMEDSLIVEGYFYSSTNSNSLSNSWLESGNQTGTSAEVRNNVQLIYGFPTAADPNTGSGTDAAAQPSWGYTLQGHSFGATVENNIISGAMLEDDLADGAGAAAFGMRVALAPGTYRNGSTYSQKNNVIRDNIVYRTSKGITIEGDSTGIENIEITGNTVVSSGAPLLDDLRNSTNASELSAAVNSVYSDVPPSTSSWITNNVTASYSNGLGAGNLFPDPDRTLKRYLLEVLGVGLLDWDDDPYLDPAQRTARKASGEAYDPAGMKTFAAMATMMRRGGTVPIPSGGAKPVYEADYAWDDRLTANEINNWIREGFGRDPVE